MSLTSVQVELELHANPDTTVLKEGGQTSTQRLSLDPTLEVVTDVPTNVSRSRATAITVILTGVSFLNTMGSGLLTVGLPRIASDLDLPENLLLWPASVYALTAGCALLICGSLADVIGSRLVFLVGCGLFVAFTLACGLAKTGVQLIIFRALLGVAMSMCLPSAVSIITHSFPPGKRRNIGFACMGAGQPLGYSVGLVLGGVFTDSIGWRYGYYLSAIINFILLGAAIWGLPRDHQWALVSWKRLSRDIDWIGAILLSMCVGLLSYVLATVTASYTRMKDPANVAMLCIAVALLPIFVLWVGRQERLQKPAIIPNSLWRNRPFTCICITVFLTWAVFNALQYFATLFFQRVQQVSAIQTSIRFLPMVIVGALTNVVTGFCVNKVSAQILVVVSAAISAVSPLLMAIINRNWTYWRAAFPAMLLSPINPDVLFTVSNLIITDVFPSHTQALAGGVFNTISQLGNSVGLAVTAAIAASVTAHRNPSRNEDMSSPDMLMAGYRAVFWTMFASMVLVCVASVMGLRKVGKVGLKSE